MMTIEEAARERAGRLDAGEYFLLATDGEWRLYRRTHDGFDRMYKGLHGLVGFSVGNELPDGQFIGPINIPLVESDTKPREQHWEERPCSFPYADD